MTNATIKATKVLGYDADYTTCDCCGKSNLKKTVVFECESGQLHHYGTTCITKAFGKSTAKNMTNEAECINIVTSFIKRYPHMTPEQVQRYASNKGLGASIRGRMLLMGTVSVNMRLAGLEVYQQSVSWWAS